MSPDRDRARHSAHKADGRVRGRKQGRETGDPNAEDRETGDPAEKGDHGVKEHREAEAPREVQERPRVVEDREAADPLEVDSPNSPRKGLT